MCNLFAGGGVDWLGYSSTCAKVVVEPQPTIAR